MVGRARCGEFLGGGEDRKEEKPRHFPGEAGNCGMKSIEDCVFSPQNRNKSSPLAATGLSTSGARIPIQIQHGFEQAWPRFGSLETIGQPLLNRAAAAARDCQRTCTCVRKSDEPWSSGSSPPTVRRCHSTRRSKQTPSIQHRPNRCVRVAISGLPSTRTARSASSCGSDVPLFAAMSSGSSSSSRLQSCPS
jgi:hypothetical protein